MPNIDSETAGAIAKILAVNAGVTLLLAFLSYVIAALALDGLALIDRWLEPSRKQETGNIRSTDPEPDPS